MRCGKILVGFLVESSRVLQNGMVASSHELICQSEKVELLIPLVELQTLLLLNEIVGTMDIRISLKDIRRRISITVSMVLDKRQLCPHLVQALSYHIQQQDLGAAKFLSNLYRNEADCIVYSCGQHFGIVRCKNHITKVPLEFDTISKSPGHRIASWNMG